MTRTITREQYEHSVWACQSAIVPSILSRLPVNGPIENDLFFTVKTAEVAGISPGIIRRYPERMVLRLNQAYWGLFFGEVMWGCTLVFGGEEADVYMPHTAVLSVSDPTVDFFMELGPYRPPIMPEQANDGNVVRLDDFRGPRS